jgi:serine protease AprX
MLRRHKSPKPVNRDQRHSAAWGKRASMALVLATAMIGVALGQGSNNAVHSTISPELTGLLAKARQGTANGETVKVIVQYHQVPTDAHYATMQGRGGKLNAKLQLVKAAAFTIPVSALPALESDSEIASVTVDHPVRGLDETTDAVTNVPSAWSSGYNGAGIGVAVIDSGINDSHPDLWNSAENKSRVVYRQDFTGTANTNSSGGKYDLYGHGTHVAGIIGGNGYLSSGNYEGVAPAVNLVDLRALDLNGVGTDSTVIAAIQEAISLQNTYNIQVINLSLGRGIAESYTQDPLCQAVESAWKAGIVVVVAAGNYGRLSIDGSDGYGTITAPGNDPFVITVGALNSNGSTAQSAEIMTSYTSKGPTTYDHVVKPDIMAPGNNIVSLSAPGATLETLFPSLLVNGNTGKPSYFTLSGTSMATPVVSGSVALLLQQNPNMTPDQVKARLMQTTYQSFPTSTVVYVPQLNESFTEYYDVFSVGTGLLNVQAALADNTLAPSNLGAALSPSVTYNSSNSTVNMADGNSSVAARNTVWGSTRAWSFASIWGNVNGNSIVWGATLPWNDNLLAAFSIVWGASTSSGSQAQSIVWGAAALSSDSASVSVTGDPQ